MVTREELYQFEEEVVQMYKEGKLRSPVHLSGSIDGNLEDFLINIFKGIRKEDWVFSTYRSHAHALLKNIPKDWLKQWILSNKSIHVENLEYRVVTSAIVGGMLSWATGVGLGIKLQGKDEKVYCFIGDMTTTTGQFHESFQYCVKHKLPVKFICECNYLSTDTDTAEVWGITRKEFLVELQERRIKYPQHFDYCVYKRLYPHYGIGTFVLFPEDKKELVQTGKDF